MEKETLKKILEFLEKEDNKKHKYRDTFMWKLKFDEPITEDELNFDGDLILNDSAITSLPEGLRVQGDLSLFASAIKTLPEGLYVKGSLDVSHTYIESLPDNLYVGGDLWFKYSNIGEIPKNLYAGGELDIEHTPLDKKYTDAEIRRNKNLNKGLFNGNIIR
jgi:hypothetical protein